MRTLNLTLKVWRQDGPDAAGPLRDHRGARHQRRHVVPRDARRRQRAADQRGPGADHLRPRLPRGHLRHVLAHDQRPGPRARSGARPPASSTCASSTTAHTIVDRAVAGRRLPDHQGPDGRPVGVRPHHRGGRLHHRADRRRARRQPHPRPEGRWPTRRWTPRSASAAAPAWPPARTVPPTCSPRPRSPHLNLLPQGQPERYRRVEAMVRRRWRSTSARARTTASARRRARRASRSTSSPS